MRTLFAMQTVGNFMAPTGVMVLGVVWPGGVAIRGDRSTSAAFRRNRLPEE